MRSQQFRYTFAFLAAGLIGAAPLHAEPIATDDSGRLSAAEQSRWRLEPITDRAVLGSHWRLKDTRATAMRWELSYHLLSAVDTIQTVSCLRKGQCDEGNPLMGKQPKMSKMIAGKLLVSAVQVGLFKYAYDRNPRTALRMAQVSCALQGTAVLLNARFTLQ